MINNIVGLGYGVITLAVLLGVGSLILLNMGGSVGCGNLGVPWTWSSTQATCYNSSNVSQTTAPTGAAYTNTNYLLTTLGSTNGGLASWVPTVIVVFIGLLFLGAFMIGKGTSKKGQY
jgi:hypothetical protein